MANNRLTFENWAESIFPSSPFQATTSLRKLILRNNSILYMISEWNQVNLQLEELDLSFNNISSINIHDLNFSSNKINVNLTNNHIVDISFYQLQILMLADLELNRKIEHNIYLEHNPIDCTCRAMEFNKYLRNQNPNYIKIIAGDLRCASPESMADRLLLDIHPREFLCPLDTPNTKIKRCPESCKCDFRQYDLGLIIDCSNLSLRTVPDLPRPGEFKLDFIELYVENNQLDSLPIITNETLGYNYVNEIHAKNNSITMLQPENIPPNLKILNLSGNQMTTMNQSVLNVLNATKNLERISLDNNPWLCDCKASPLLIFTKEHFDKIYDFASMQCSDGRYLKENGIEDLCPKDQTIIIAVSIVLTLLGFSIGMLAAFYYKYQQEIKVWLFANNLMTWFVTEYEVDMNKKYDAFLSYSHVDMDFVTEYIVPGLENSEHPFKICLHERDWTIGQSITQSVSFWCIFIISFAIQSI